MAYLAPCVHESPIRTCTDKYGLRNPSPFRTYSAATRTGTRWFGMSEPSHCAAVTRQHVPTPFPPRNARNARIHSAKERQSTRRRRECV
eukprot:3418354-Rhodomonas_salina.1